MVTRRYHCFPTYVDNAANRSLKVRIEKELFCMRGQIKVWSFQGKKKNPGKRFRRVRLDTVWEKGQRRKKLLKNKEKFKEGDI